MLPIFPVLKPKISLIFINYQSAWHLQRALESLVFHEPEESRREIIVVNNDSDERRVLELLQKRYGFLLLNSGKNIGFAKAANLGGKRATGEVLGFINPDTLWIKSVLPQVRENFSRLPSCGALGIQLVDEQGNPDSFDSGKEISAISTFLRHFMFGRQQRAVPLQLTGWVSGGALFLKKQVFSSVGGFDEDFFLYFEDVDLCQRIRDKGLRIYKDFRIRLLHYGGKSHSSESSKKQHYYTSQDIYFKKHRSSFEGKIVSFVRMLLYRQ